MKLVKYGVLHGISTPALYGLFIHACRAVGGMISICLTMKFIVLIYYGSTTAAGVSI